MLQPGHIFTSSNGFNFKSVYKDLDMISSFYYIIYILNGFNFVYQLGDYLK